jgi:hypothetical protein
MHRFFLFILFLANVASYRRRTARFQYLARKGTRMYSQGTAHRDSRIPLGIRYVVSDTGAFLFVAADSGALQCRQLREYCVPCKSLAVRFYTHRTVDATFLVFCSVW